MNTRYDVAIIGCGEAGIFAGYELMHRNPGLKVVTLDQGADIYTRSCPIVAGKVKECIHCKVCHRPGVLHRDPRRPGTGEEGPGV